MNENLSNLSRRQLLQLAAMGTLGAGTRILAADGHLLTPTEDLPETENNWEGPFYKAGAPERSNFVEKGITGIPLVITGRILDVTCTPLRGAKLDLWHADRRGVYDNEGFRLRGHLYTNSDGRYTLTTIKPLYYGVPGDMRPSHIHVKVSHEKSHILTTQLYFKGDPWNRHDPGVRPSLILAPRSSAKGLEAEFNFVLRTA